MRDNQDALDARLAAVMAANDLSGMFTVCMRYPPVGRELTKFESLLRDWGLVCGIAFGLALAERPDDADPDDNDANRVFAERAYKAARPAFARWAGEIEDPDKARERVMRQLLAAFSDVQDRASEERRSGKTGEPRMTTDLRAALGELEVVMGTVVA